MNPDPQGGESNMNEQAPKEEPLCHRWSMCVKTEGNGLRPGIICRKAIGAFPTPKPEGATTQPPPASETTMQHHAYKHNHDYPAGCDFFAIGYGRCGLEKDNIRHKQPVPSAGSKPQEEPPITDAQICLLSRLFNRNSAGMHGDEYFDINKWLEWNIQRIRKQVDSR